VLTISKPLSGGQARTYHAREFAAKEANYWSREQQGRSEWQGSRLQELGYEIERGKHGQPEIKGYSQEYLEASSPRREQIKSHLQETGREGAGATQVAAHRTRDSKEI
jgi:hypothetical protein